MRRHKIIFTLIAALGSVAATVAAAPDDQKQTDRSTPPASADAADATGATGAGDDIHVTVRAGRGRLGFAALQISAELRTHLGAPADRGVLVDSVRADSPAARAGLRVGDVITEVDGAPCRSASDVLDAISDRKKGDTVGIAVARGKARVQLRATLEDDPGPAWRAFGSAGGTGRFGGFDERAWDIDVFKDFPKDMQPMFDRGEMRRALEEAQKRLQELEQRVDKIDRRRS
jgi:membrane-associated protease RseP (regulator of RpoE activity)